MFVFLGNFYAKHSKWRSSDKNNKDGIALENMTSTAGFNRIVNEPIHFTNVSASSIDFVFTSNASYLTTGIEQSIYDKAHHNITYRKFHFNIPLPAPYCKKI